MEHVGVQDLLNCRLVNSVWTPIATTRLNKLHTPCSSFQYQYIPKCYGGLSELMKCAKNSVKFPCTSFTFRAGDMRSEDAKEFLTLMGSSAKTLTLYAVDNATLCSDMNLTTILSHTPNLETLVFAGCFDTITTRATLALPLLKYIKIDGEVYTSMTEIKLILNGAPHLENIANVWRLNNLEPILTTKKIHTVKSWCPSTFAFPSGFIQLVTATEDQLKLSELVVFIDESNRHNLMEIDAELLWNCFQKVLNQNTVRKLILKRSKYPVNAAFPLNMDNVKELVLMSDSHSEYKHFPHRINLNTTFPRLTTLSFYDPMLCCAVCCADRERENRFPFLDEFADSNGSFPSVTTLNLRDGSTSIRMLRRMKKICPNVQNLEICLKGKIDRKRIVQELCGEWRHLKKLTIDLQQNELKDNLDLAFTGLCPAYIESLNGDLTLTDKQKLRRVEDTRYVLWIGNISGKKLGMLFVVTVLIVAFVSYPQDWFNWM